MKEIRRDCAYKVCYYKRQPRDYRQFREEMDQPLSAL